MKANQKFTQADEAVSPVIGVILMVAITVVLAAVVFVLVSDLGDSGEAAPDMSFSKSSSDQTATVVRADTGLTWGQFTIGGTCTSATNYAAPLGTDPVAAGDVLDCSTEGGTLSITHDATNTLVYTTTFA